MEAVYENGPDNGRPEIQQSGCEVFDLSSDTGQTGENVFAARIYDRGEEIEQRTNKQEQVENTSNVIQGTGAVEKVKQHISHLIVSKYIKQNETAIKYDTINAVQKDPIESVKKEISDLLMEKYVKRQQSPDSENGGVCTGIVSGKFKIGDGGINSNVQTFVNTNASYNTCSAATNENAVHVEDAQIVEILAKTCRADGNSASEMTAEKMEYTLTECNENDESIVNEIVGSVKTDSIQDMEISTLPTNLIGDHVTFQEVDHDTSQDVDGFSFEENSHTCGSLSIQEIKQELHETEQNQAKPVSGPPTKVVLDLSTISKLTNIWGKSYKNERKPKKAASLTPPKKKLTIRTCSFNTGDSVSSFSQLVSSTSKEKTDCQNLQGNEKLPLVAVKKKVGRPKLHKTKTVHISKMTNSSELLRHALLSKSSSNKHETTNTSTAGSQTMCISDNLTVKTEKRKVGRPKSLKTKSSQLLGSTKKADNFSPDDYNLKHCSVRLIKIDSGIDGPEKSGLKIDYTYSSNVEMPDKSVNKSVKAKRGRPKKSMVRSLPQNATVISVTRDTSLSKNETNAKNNSQDETAHDLVLMKDTPVVVKRKVGRPKKEAQGTPKGKNLNITDLNKASLKTANTEREMTDQHALQYSDENKDNVADLWEDDWQSGDNAEGDSSDDYLPSEEEYTPNKKEVLKNVFCSKKSNKKPGIRCYSASKSNASKLKHNEHFANMKQKGKNKSYVRKYRKHGPRIGRPPNTGEYKCKKCEFITYENKLILEHYKEVHQRELMYCQYCDFASRSKNVLLQHEGQKHTGNKPFKCEMEGCNYATNVYTDFKRHESQKHATEKAYKCPKCDFRTKWRRNIVHHDKIIHNHVRAFVCNICNFAFKRINDLKGHLQRHSDDKPFQCDQCGFRCKSNWEIKSHKLSHSNVRPYPCTHPGCKQACKTKSDLSKHMVVHETARTFKCSMCDRTYKNYVQMKKHERGPLHITTRNFKCELCDKAFKTKQSLEKHLLIHKGIKPFKCDVCDKDFIAKQNLAAHKVTHNLDERPYHCPICPFGAKLPTILLTHIGSMHGNSHAYYCELCKKPFKRYSQLQMHYRRVHTEEDCKKLGNAFEVDLALMKMEMELDLDDTMESLNISSKSKKEKGAVVIKEEPVGEKCNELECGIVTDAELPPDVCSTEVRLVKESEILNKPTKIHKKRGRPKKVKPVETVGKEETWKKCENEVVSKNISDNGKTRTSMVSDSRLDSISVSENSEKAERENSNDIISKAAEGQGSKLETIDSNITELDITAKDGQEIDSSSLQCVTNRPGSNHSNGKTSEGEQSNDTGELNISPDSDHKPQHKSMFFNKFEEKGLATIAVYDGFRLPLATKGFQFNYEKRGKKTKSWFMDPSYMNEDAREKQMKYLRRMGVAAPLPRKKRVFKDRKTGEIPQNLAEFVKDRKRKLNYYIKKRKMAEGVKLSSEELKELKETLIIERSKRKISFMGSYAEFENLDGKELSVNEVQERLPIFTEKGEESIVPKKKQKIMMNATKAGKNVGNKRTKKAVKSKQNSTKGKKNVLLYSEKWKKTASQINIRKPSLFGNVGGNSFNEGTQILEQVGVSQTEIKKDNVDPSALPQGKKRKRGRKPKAFVEKEKQIAKTKYEPVKPKFKYVKRSQQKKILLENSSKECANSAKTLSTLFDNERKQSRGNSVKPKVVKGSVKHSKRGKGNKACKNMTKKGNKVRIKIARKPVQRANNKFNNSSSTVLHEEVANNQFVTICPPPDIGNTCTDEHISFPDSLRQNNGLGNVSVKHVIEGGKSLMYCDDVAVMKDVSSCQEVFGLSIDQIKSETFVELVEPFSVNQIFNTGTVVNPVHPILLTQSPVAQQVIQPPAGMSIIDAPARINLNNLGLPNLSVYPTENQNIEVCKSRGIAAEELRVNANVERSSPQNIDFGIDGPTQEDRIVVQGRVIIQESGTDKEVMQLDYGVVKQEPEDA